MSSSDPIADMLTRIRNGLERGHKYVLVPSSKLKLAIAGILKEEGYVQDYDMVGDDARQVIRIWLKYAEGRRPVITHLEQVSRPGRRMYTGRREIPWVRSGLGIAILSTPLGAMTGQEARRRKVGGEILCYVW
jgi:small subunit ribosomal protein S8